MLCCAAQGEPHGTTDKSVAVERGGDSEGVDVLGREQGESTSFVLSNGAGHEGPAIDSGRLGLTVLTVPTAHQHVRVSPSQCG